MEEKKHQEKKEHQHKTSEVKKEHTTKEHHKKKQKLNLETISFILAGVLVLIIMLNAFNLGTLKGKMQDASEQAAEAAILPEIAITLLTNQNCPDCFDITASVDALKTGINLTEELTHDIESTEAAALIAKYNIENIPAMILTGEVDKLNKEDFDKKEDALVYEAASPPYTDALTKKVVGKVAITIIQDSSCTDCTDLTPLSVQLKGTGVAMEDQKTVDSKTPEAKALIAKYNIERLPAAILSEDAGLYPQIAQIWSQIGTIEEDHTFITRLINPPYKEISTGDIKGLVTLTYLTDTSCTECYDVKIHKQILEGFGLKIVEEMTVDSASSEGKALLDKYSITAVPTVLMSKDTEAYTALLQVWAQVGSIETDGTYIFRELSQMGANIKYKDLYTNQIVENPAQ